MELEALVWSYFVLPRHVPWNFNTCTTKEGSFIVLLCALDVELLRRR